MIVRNSTIVFLAWYASSTCTSAEEPQTTFLRGRRGLQQTTTPPLLPSNLRHVACGRGIGDGLSPCPEGDSLLVNVDSLHELRCCRDGAASSKWKHKCTSDDNAFSGVYGMSKIDGDCHEVNFANAIAKCASVDGRLCTINEIFGSCTKDTGCGSNEELIWTCEEEGAGCTSSSSCCSGWCGAGGECSSQWPISNKVVNPGFEDADISPWNANFNTGAVVLDASQSHSGSNSVLLTGRQAGWNAVAQDVFGKLNVGVEYRFSCWVKLKNASSSFFKMALRVTKDTGTKHPGVLKTVLTNDWTKLEGTVTVETGGTLTGLLLFVEGPAAGVEYWVDDVEIVEASTTMTSEPTDAPTNQLTLSLSPQATPTATPPTSPTSINTCGDCGNYNVVASADCSGFYYCNGDGQPSGSFFSCGAGTLFSQSIQGCDWDYSVTCACTSPTTVPTPTPTSEPTDAPTNHPTVLLSSTPSKLPSLKPEASPSTSPTIPLYCISGILRDNICCPSSCGGCGGSGCGGLPGGGSQCCTSKIKETGNYCVEFSDTACIVPSSSTNTPTALPTRAPTPSSTPEIGGPSVYGDGPFISLASSSEIVTIPRPPLPADMGQLRTGCPHDQGGLLNWHDAATWTNNNVPNAGEDVTLPENSKVIIAQSVTEELGVITVPASSELIFDENAAGITIDIAGMDVQGSLLVGAESCRYLSDLTITLHGSRPNDLDIFGKSKTAAETYKGISVNGGVISIHGKRHYPTWTRLAQTAPAGQNYLLVQEPLDWETGQEIVLTTTAVHDSRNWHQNEVLVVSSVVLNPCLGVGAAIHLESEIAHNHIANSGYQAEVGLLSRNVKVQGAADDSEPTDPDPGTCTNPSRKHYGSNLAPCAGTDTTGFGGHIMVHSGGKGYLEGVELFRMGQTNVLGRYPFHWHMLENSCEDCYFKDNSIHRSFYRCISIHGTHGTLVTENVAYDVNGFCYYLESGVEEDNILSFNLAAHIHPVSNIIANSGDGQSIPVFSQSSTLILPADVTASGFYLTNLHNDFIGNAASGGWSGFALPVLHSPIGPNKDANIRPANRLTKTFDGNTAHSTGWWWSHAGAFYSGGSLYYPSGSNLLEYNAGRDQSKGNRAPCLVDKCVTKNNCGDYCGEGERAWNLLTNSKVFMVASPGLNSWSGRMEIINFEAHDVELGMEALESGFGIDNLLVECRSGESWAMPGNPNQAKANGFFWYDTGQEHIITNAKFRNCGSKSGYNHYDNSPTRGCNTNSINGCRAGSTVWGLLTHSDEHTPEIMQATRNITYEDCGRRFSLVDYKDNNLPSSVSGRNQNWLDVDGTASGILEPTIIGSGLSDAGKWWDVESDTIHDPDGPLTFIKANNGPERGLGHIRLRWKDSVHNTVGKTSCLNGPKRNAAGNPYCPAIGHIRHVGSLFDASKDPSGGLPITANSEVPGLVGGFGWALSLNDGAPKTLKIDQVEVDSTTPLMLAIRYPKGTKFTIAAHAAYCSPSTTKTCTEAFQETDSVQHVRFSQGNTYYFDQATNVLWIRIIQFPQTYTGDTMYSQTPQWHLWDNDDINPQTTWNPNDYALDRFSFGGITLPKSKFGYVNRVEITADCTDNSVSGYCDNTPAFVDPEVCSPGYVQVSYDKCCVSASSSNCETFTPPPTGSPTPPPTYGETSNLLENPGFENSLLSPWISNYGTGVTIDRSEKRSGSKSALCAKRSKDWNGVKQNLLGRLNVGVQYRYSAWAKLKTGSSSSFKLTFKITKDTGTEYHGITGTITNTRWTKLEGKITISTSGTLTGLEIYSSGPAANVDFWVDDVEIAQADGLFV